MGIWSKPVNLIACTWVIFISVILFFPTTKPVTPTNMNYAICVAGFVGLFSLGWWWIGARKYVITWKDCSPFVVVLTVFVTQEVHRPPYQRYHRYASD